jgi:type VII secretion integral membrane protein EccD
MASGLSRVTVVSPRSRVDIALPADVPMVELLPTLLAYAGAGGNDAGRRDGWALSRVGGAELDTSRTAEQLSVRDGELLLLRPHESAGAATVFDDVIDTLATGATDRRGRWTAAATRTAFLVLAVLALTGTAAGLVTAGPPYSVPGLVSLGLGATLLIVAVVYARALGAARAGAAFGFLSTVYCGLGGLLVSLGDRRLGELGVAHTIVAVGVAAVAAAVAATGVPTAAPLFLAAALVAVAVPAGLGLSTVLHGGAAAGAAAVVVVAYAFLPALPMFAYRLAGLPRPSVPTEREHMLEETETIDGTRILELGRRADAFLAAMLAALSVISAGTAVLVSRIGWRGAALALVLAVLPLLRSRWFSWRAQRVPLLASGSVALAATVIAVGTRLDHADRLLMIGGIALLVILCCIAMGLSDNRQAAPPWGRFLDLVEILLILSIAPLAVWVSGILELVRAVRG